jgi:4-oxalocrotonate tautomerase
MPLINVKLIDGVFSESQKKQIATKLTDAMVSIEGENMRPVAWVVIEEVKSGDWAIDGKVLTTADVKALATTSLQSAPSSTGRTAAGVARVGT